MGEREREYQNRPTSPPSSETQSASGGLAKEGRGKLPSRSEVPPDKYQQELTETKSLFLEALVQMNRERLQNISLRLNVHELLRSFESHKDLPPDQFKELVMEKVLGQIQEQEAYSSTKPKEDPSTLKTGTDKESAKETRRRLKYDLEVPPESKIDDPPNLPEGFEPKQSPFLTAIFQSVAFRAESQVLRTENKQLRDENEELIAREQRRKEKDRQRKAKKRQDNRQEYNTYMRDLYAKKKQQTKPSS